MESNQPTFETIRENVRRLTCLLHGLSPQLGAASEHVSKDNLARFYAHLAVLLTVGGGGSADVLAITGGPLKALSYELSLVGSLASDAQKNKLDDGEICASITTSRGRLR